MSESFFVNDFSSGVNDNTTTYYSITGVLTSDLTEVRVQIPVRDAGTFSNLYTYVSTNTTLVNSVITFRKNSSDTAITVTYTSGQTGVKEDTTNSDTVANTDVINYKVAVDNDVSGTKTITFKVMGVKFTPTNSSDSISLLANSSSVNYSTASSSLYFCPNGYSGAGNSTETDGPKYRIRGTFTSTDLYTYVSANARTTNTVYRTRKNGANGGQSVTYTSTQTGVKEDTSGSDSLSAGDDYNYQLLTSTGTGNITTRFISTTLTSTSNLFILLNGSPVSPDLTSNITRYSAIAGSVNLEATEANSQMLSRVSFTAKELGTFVAANTNASLACVVTVRDNGADSAMTVSYAAAQTGLKSDTSNTATITSGTDNLNYKLVNSDLTGTVTFRWLSMLGETAGGGGGSATHPGYFASEGWF